MGEYMRTIQYRCSDDCVPSGCPGHSGELHYNSVCDTYRFVMDGKVYDIERGELDAMIRLLADLRRPDSAKVHDVITPKL